jgi:hypothetical protein
VTVAVHSCILNIGVIDFVLTEVKNHGGKISDTDRKFAFTEMQKT